MWDQWNAGFWQKFCFIFSLSLYLYFTPSLGVNKLLLLLLFLIFRNADSPLGKLLKGQPSVAKNIYSFGFGKVRCCGEWFSNDIRAVFSQNLLFLTVIIPPVLFLTFSAFLFLLKRWEQTREGHKYSGLWWLTRPGLGCNRRNSC